MILSRLIILIYILLFLSSCSFQPKVKIKKSNLSSSILSTESLNTLDILDKYNKVIIRDSWGVPHVFGKTDKDAAFALAYAHAQDDFPTIQDALLKARGKYASVYGGGKDNINAILDYMVGLLKIWDNVENKYYTDLSAETIKICEGYAEGINYFIENNIDDINQYIYPVSGKDVVAGTLHKTPFFFQLPLFLSDLYFKEPHQIPSSYTIGETIDKITGSNVYAIAPTRTDNNSTFLAINSHQPFDGELAWYEAHITSEEGWNMVGGLFPGSPVVLVGHNESLGWGHTVNKPDILDIYELEINPDNPNQYKFDDKWLNFETYDINIKIKTLGKLQYNHKQPAYWSIHGPVIKGEKATYAIRYSNMDDIKIIEQWYKMNKANNFEEWKEAMKLISVPMFNAGYADKEGNIYFVYNAKLPIRNEEYNWKKVLPGNTSKVLWNEFLPYDKLPQILNPSSGFIQNCNNTPYQTTIGEDNINENNFSKTLGIETHMTNRALRAYETFGEDNNITYDEFKEYKFDIKYSESSTIKKLLNRSTDLLIDINFPNISSKVIQSAKQIINQWNLSSDINNLNAALPIISFAKYIDVYSDNITDEVIIKQLNFSISYLLEHYNELNVPWGDVNRLIRGDTNLAINGAPDVARAIYGIPHNETGQLKAIAGDCYILLAQWNEKQKLSSESIHQYGSSTYNHDSPHFDDQSKLFVNQKFKTISIFKEDIIKDVKDILILDENIN